MSDRVLSRLVAVAEVRGRSDVEVTTTEAERTALAAAYDLMGVRGLAATVTLSPEPEGGIDVEGHVSADIVQACVVTLEPVEQHIEEPFSLRFVPPGSPELAEAARPQAEIVIDPAAPDPPEALEGPTVDIGAIVEEAFVLGIDPYPRAPGAMLPEEAEDKEPGADSPFAVLARLTPRKS